MHFSSQQLPPTHPLAALRAIATRTPHDYALLHSAAATSPPSPSILAFNPLCRLLIDSTGAAHLTGSRASLPTNPLLALQTLIAQTPFTVDNPLAKPLLGWLGFLSYDINHDLESIPRSPHSENSLHWPRLCFTLFRHYLLFTENSTLAFSLEGVNENLQQLLQSPPSPGTIPPATLLHAQPRHAFTKSVQRIIDYIAAGDIYQANLAQHWSLQTAAAPHDLFANLCELTPAPFAACLRFTHNNLTNHIVSASPELFLSLNNNHAVTRPIKGTRPRDNQNPQRDAALRDELLASAKDQAELTMIVDLLRNDLGRVSTYGTVRVPQPRTLEPHPTVWHTVATVESTLRENTTLAELLAALCPGGSITGAPKIRAMQIIEELESNLAPGLPGETMHQPNAHAFQRNLYCGNIGLITPPTKENPNLPEHLTLNIAIRTILLQNQTAHIYAGAGIVADSNPQKEYEETLHKAAALFRALRFEREM